MYLNYFKRTLDLSIIFFTLPAFMILYLIIGLLIKIEDGGPVFYKSARIGKNNKIFNMYKFRSMIVNAPNRINIDGSTYNSKNDPRMTKVGKFIRETSLDETPQILNVLKGEMSIIGPRASLAHDLISFKTDEIEKMRVLPGITGLTQAYFRNGLSVREKRLKDAWYANNVGLCLDLKIIFRTILTILKRDNIYTNAE